jgi:hypothetical protein
MVVLVPFVFRSWRGADGSIRITVAAAALGVAVAGPVEIQLQTETDAQSSATFGTRYNE